MKIIFLCGSLESGRDGVGDYTRRLAAELMRRGHKVWAVAMYDRHISEVIIGKQETETSDLPVLRIPFIWKDQDRFARIKAWVDDIHPNWLSLQFVPYSFHAKGVPLRFLRQITKWKNEYSWHIMFHELWLSAPYKVKEYFISWVQKFIIYRLAAKLRPYIINVSIPYNQRRLKTIGVKSTILDLFGNIAIGKCEEAIKHISDAAPLTKNLLYFGNAPRGPFLHKVVKELSSFCNSHDRPVNIIVVSGNTRHKDVFVKLLNESLIAGNGKVIDCGYVDSDALSTLISKCTVGISRSRPHLLGKSGSAIAMLEHGMPIWLPQWEDDTALQFNFRPHLIFQDLRKAASVPSHEAYRSLLPEVTRNFLYQLQNA